MQPPTGEQKMFKQPHVSLASKSKLLVQTGFKNFDLCANSYVGCQFACTYCYVRFFVKDPVHDWGDFVRVRSWAETQLNKELTHGTFKLKTGTRDEIDQVTAKTKKKPVYTHTPIDQLRLVIGTMTDPYQPIETKERITRTILTTLAAHETKFKKHGLFTRSPLVLNDLELIKSLPAPQIHYTITPYPKDILKQIEPISPTTQARWKVIKQIKESGIRTHVNIAPIIPHISEDYIPKYVQNLAELKIDEYFVDPIQPYPESLKALDEGIKNHPKYQQIIKTITDKQAYAEWKQEYYEKWQTERRKHQHLAPDQTPIWSDHVHHVWVNMKTEKHMNPKDY